MNSRKKIIIVASITLSLLLGWYLFVKESDYCITFKVKTASGTIFQGIQEWTTNQKKSKSENYSIIEKRNFDYIKQEMENGKSQLEYTWEMKPINDSVTKVIVGIKDLNHSIYNRLTAPFYSTNFKKEQIAKVTDLKNGLEKLLENFKVKIDGEGKSEETFVAYINLKAVLQEKAQNMIKYNEDIVSYLHNNNIKIIGSPYVEIGKWDFEKETLDYNYCFPIDKNTKYIEDKSVKFKTIPAQKGLKATYYGNFRTSDRAWFTLIDYAKTHDIKLENKPLEHFLDNPFNGGNELEWKTEIIIPFASK
ncbi:GyrI-like domain-containing protein [Flavobacterium sp.]|uniref:GyrI-like domain-containing protein n=1 Tax=Flavobacterium sp. TaxID=239 RepID=UPI0037B19E0F